MPRLSVKASQVLDSHLLGGAEYPGEAGEGSEGFEGAGSLNQIFQINTNRKTAPSQSQGLVNFLPQVGQNSLPGGYQPTLQFRQVIADVSAS